jgi:hypothetical protein
MARPARRRSRTSAVCDEASGTLCTATTNCVTMSEQAQADALKAEGTAAYKERRFDEAIEKCNASCPAGASNEC